MILLDTHVLVWWSVNSSRLSAAHREAIRLGEADGIAVSAFTFWEVAMLDSKNRVDLGGRALDVWFDRTTSIRTLHILPATPLVLVESTRLPGEFHADPADRIIVATARVHGLPLLTEDQKILDYSHVVSVGPA